MRSARFDEMFFPLAMLAFLRTGADNQGMGNTIATRKPSLSASKSGVLRGNLKTSPHPNRTKGPFCPHPQKKSTNWPHGWIFGWAGNLATAFQYSSDKFWEMVESLSGIEKVQLEKRKISLGRKTLTEVKWQSLFPRQVSQHQLFVGLAFTSGRGGDPNAYSCSRCPDNDIWASLPSDPPPQITENFVSVFVDAIRDRTFPKGREAQARFLGNSLAAMGTVSARRSRDICGEGRAKKIVPPKLGAIPSWWESQADPKWRTEQWARLPVDYRSQLLADREGAAAPEIYVNCCGGKRWTVGQICPKCGRSPLGTSLPFAT
jgi:hypothetical protein